VRTPPGLVNAITAPPLLSALVAAQLGIGDDIAERGFPPASFGVRDSVWVIEACQAVGDRGCEFIVGGKQRGLLRILDIGAGADNDVVGLGADDVAGRGIELQIDRGDDGAVTCRHW